MPLVRIDVVKGRNAQEIRALLDAIHRAIISAFEVPDRDRYQVIHEHSESHMVLQDTGLGIVRTSNVVVVSVTSRPRSEESKQKFYENLCTELAESCGVSASDVIVSIMINSDADWSFGHGRAQFLSGEL